MYKKQKLIFTWSTADQMRNCSVCVFCSFSILYELSMKAKYSCSWRMTPVRIIRRRSFCANCCYSTDTFTGSLGGGGETTSESSPSDWTKLIAANPQSGDCSEGPIATSLPRRAHLPDSALLPPKVRTFPEFLLRVQALSCERARAHCVHVETCEV